MAEPQRNKADTALEKKMTLGEHLEELRRRIIYALLGLLVGTGLSLIFAKRILGLLRRPYDTVMGHLELPAALAVLDVTAALITFIRVGLLAGLILSCPWVFYQLWKFVAAGLYRHERRYVMTAVPFSAALFVCGALFFLFVVAEPVLYFLVHFSQWLDVEPVITLPHYIGFVTGLMFAFGLCFQTPLLILVLTKVGLVSIKTLRRYRRHVIVLILIVAALATSPSPIDQVALAVPMYLLYELGILLAYLAARKKKQSGDEPAG
jgi:sec-independent protein translocase protein TatC